MAATVEELPALTARDGWADLAAVRAGRVVAVGPAERRRWCPSRLLQFGRAALGQSCL